MDRLIAIGDIHGCIHTLKALLKEISYDSSTDTLVFLGDYIDRGDYSYEVVSLLRKLQNQVGKDKVICLRGNHEQMAIDAYDNCDCGQWYCNGGMMTNSSFEQNGEDMSSAVRWFKTLPHVYETPKIIFCHAGLSKPLLKDNTAEDFLWGRKWIKTATQAREKQVVFGHTPNRAGFAYVVDTGDICIDTACVYGGALCALVIQEDGTSECFYVKKAKEDEDM